MKRRARPFYIFVCFCIFIITFSEAVPFVFAEDADPNTDTNNVEVVENTESSALEGENASPQTSEPKEEPEPGDTTETKPTETPSVKPAAKLNKRLTKPKVNRSFKGKNATRIPVITYHQLCSDKEKKYPNNRNESLVISESAFRRQMKWLHDHKYRTLSMEEFYLWKTGKIRVPKKSVLITFDDGYYSVIKYALPILKKYNMRATMFMIGSKIPQKTNKKALNGGRYAFTGWDVMLQVNRTYPNFEFEGHTYNMHYRKGVGKEAARTLPLSKQTEDFRTMYNEFWYRYMAYPYGAYNNNTIKAAKANHIKMAFTYGSDGYATRKQDNYKVRRIKINANHSFRKFTRWFKYK